VDIVLRRKWRISCESGPPVEKSIRGLGVLMGQKCRPMVTPVENVAPFGLIAADHWVLATIRAAAGQPLLPRTWLDTAVRAAPRPEALSRRFTPRNRCRPQGHLREFKEETLDQLGSKPRKLLPGRVFPAPDVLPRSMSRGLECCMGVNRPANLFLRLRSSSMGAGVASRLHSWPARVGGQYLSESSGRFWSIEPDLLRRIWLRSILQGTWAELERMAARISNRRTRKAKELLGYVPWPGAAV